MNTTRIQFDDTLPFKVAASELVVGDQRLHRGDPLPWRDLGIDRALLFQLWVAFKVDCLAEPSVVIPTADVVDATISMPGVVTQGIADSIEAKPKRRRRAR